MFRELQNKWEHTANNVQPDEGNRDGIDSNQMKCWAWERKKSSIGFVGQCLITRGRLISEMKTSQKIQVSCHKITSWGGTISH